MNFTTWSPSHTILAGFAAMGFNGALNRLLTVGQNG